MIPNNFRWADTLRLLMSMAGSTGIIWLMLGLQATAATESSHLVTGPDLGVPSLGRVILVFFLVTALAFAAVHLLQRIKPLTPALMDQPGVSVTVLAKRVLSRQLQVHVIETEKQRFMVVNTPQQVVVMPLLGMHSATEVRGFSADPQTAKDSVA